MTKAKVTIYQPDAHIKDGFFAVWKKIISDIINSRELIIRLFLRDFRAQYKQSVLGMLWVVINPIIVVSIFVYLNKSGIINIAKTNIPYPAFAMIGLTIWHIFSAGIPAAMGSIVAGGGIINKINFPKIVLVISAFGRSMVDFTLRTLLTVFIFVIFGVIPSWTVIFVPLAIIPLLLLTFGIGAFLSIFSVLFRDISNLVALAMNGLLLLMPIVYPAPESGIFTTVNKWNPLSHLITGVRDLTVNGGLASPEGFLWSSIFAVAVFLLFMRFFYLAEPRVAERI